MSRERFDRMICRLFDRAARRRNYTPPLPSPYDIQCRILKRWPSLRGYIR